MADKKKTFVMYESWGAAISMMDNEQAGALIKAIYEYQNNPDACPDDPSVAFVFEIIRQKMDEDKRKYDETCQARSEAGRRGGRGNAKQTEANQANASFAKQTEANQADTDNESDTDTESDSENDNEHPTGAKKRESKRENRKRFSPPTAAEVDEYCRERGNSVDAQRFVDYYASKGWVVGKTPMKDWKAAVRTWEGRETARSGTPGGYVDAIQHRFDPIKDWLQQEGNDDAGGV